MKLSLNIRDCDGGSLYIQTNQEMFLFNSPWGASFLKIFQNRCRFKICKLFRISAIGPEIPGNLTFIASASRLFQFA